MPTSPLISAAELLRPSDRRRVLLDARVGDRTGGHLAGAVPVDLDRDLARVGDPARGGRHPLPPAADFAVTVGRWGIDPDTDVVVYDAQSGGNAASRAWWMLRSLGHERVRVLDGGYAAAVAAGFPVTSSASPVDGRGPWPTAGWRWPTIDLPEADAWRADPSKVLIDARSPARYRGDEEPIDPIAGHVPGAENLFHASLVGTDGLLLPPDVVAARVAEVAGGREIAVHCGSGVTACHLALAMVHAGLAVPALYVGSWSEWCRTDRPRIPSR